MVISSPGAAWWWFNRSSDQPSPKLPSMNHYATIDCPTCNEELARVPMGSELKITPGSMYCNTCGPAALQRTRIGVVFKE